ncbi:L-amino acid oxidase [Exophiala viscosa]|uniref:L-amino acid oxidase n=1 Tax=Exophiala viscosa TaxID=2486360 RepID=A0AAN6DR59_9EURO|nr:L-amino acid oxidase [Exophiala viscosa]
MAGRAIITALLCSSAVAVSLPVSLHVRRAVDSGLANIHVSYDEPVHAEVVFTYGSCQAKSPGEAHHLVGRAKDCNHDRLLWKVPDYAPTGQCLSVWDSKQSLIGRSAPIAITPNGRTTRRCLKKRQDFAIPMDNSSGIDAEGPWFDGVALLKNKEISAVNAQEAKAKEIAIVGAGMAGLITWLALNQSGMTNLSIIEAGQRLGGRVHTAYFGDPSERQYQEMGPMRFPLSITSSETNETLQIQDHRIVFQLADEVNNLNGNNSNFTVNSSSVSQVAANASLAGASSTEDDPSLDALDTTIDNIIGNESFITQIAKNVYQAHKTFLDQGLGGLGGDDWSEFGYVHNYLKYALNDSFVAIGDPGSESFWDNLYESMYFSATDWRTIDGGLTRLPSAFHPLVDSITYMNRKIQRVQFNESTQRVTLQWKAQPLDRTFQNASYDFAIVTVPMPLVRTWRLPGFSDTLTTAIDIYPYSQVCKVALQFETRFWEHFALPIYGSCSTTTDIPGIGSICYPSYDINSTGKGVMLASYTSSDDGLRWASIPEDVHVQYVVDAMAEIHGQVVYDQYTGNYNRRCWILDQYETISWASPDAGMRKAFIPAFFQTEKGIIMSGEGTSYTSSWIASALESGVRAATQLLLELGLADEAKAVVDKWMARWIDV